MSSAVDHPLFARFESKLARLELRQGGDKQWRALFDGMSGRVIDIGPGSGVGFAFYPSAVSEVLAVEPEPYMRTQAEQAAANAPVKVRVVDGLADKLPAEDDSFDVGVTGRVLCSVPDQAAALREIRRVLRPGGELRFFEHVVATKAPLAAAQRGADRLFWTRAMGGCHTSRDTVAELERAGFSVERCRRFSNPPAMFAAPFVLGLARLPRA
ncbi:MAG: class I SAM-dependent methyltransferase [Thermoleophilaceae bacterium]|jgi:ubiquinone/menaquinone biosynthesis C-methylase UbiE